VIFREIFRHPRSAVFSRLCFVGFGAAALIAGLAVHPAPLAAKDAMPADTLLPPKGTVSAPPKPRLGSESKLPVPRFVSLKSGRINVRRGPGSDNQILWVFEKKGLPVEVTAESGRWRRIRDREGDVGWVWHAMLDGRRTAIVTGRPGDGNPVALQVEPLASANVVAYAEPGVVAQVKACKDQWCELQASGYEGWMPRDLLWGTYPGENFE
jgi:SH3-like domain-containing protein